MDQHELPHEDARASSGGSRPLESPAPPRVDRGSELGASSASREPYEFRGRTYSLRRTEITALLEVGKFRAAAKDDLLEILYRGDQARFEADLQNLLRQGLVETRIVPHEEQGKRTLLALTKTGRGLLLRAAAVPVGQAIYSGFTKPREAQHDADLYRMFQKCSKEITRKGGKNLRVVLDYEMKRRLYRDLAKLGAQREEPPWKAEVAERHGLRVIDGKIPLPDLRLEYEKADGQPARLDLELATRNYRGRSLADKVRAGFAIYAGPGDASKLRRILDQRELSAEILSL